MFIAFHIEGKDNEPAVLDGPFEMPPRVGDHIEIMGQGKSFSGVVTRVNWCYIKFVNPNDKRKYEYGTSAEVSFYQLAPHKEDG